MTSALKSITMIGCGNMGAALAKIWAQDFPEIDFHIINPSPVDETLTQRAHVTYHNAVNPGIIKASQIIILAVKPQILDAVLNEIKPDITKDTLLLSVAAGRDILSIEALSSKDQPIMRVMPNTPVAVRQGMSVACANAACKPHHKDWTAQLFTKTGAFEWLNDESLMDSVTALSGSGPAYIFHLIEILANSGEHLGFTPELAMILARQTVIGAAALAEHEPETPASKLRENVTSPGGTTQAGLDVLMDGRAQDILNETLKAAEDRGKALNQKS